MKKILVRIFAFLMASIVLGVLAVVGVIAYFSMGLPQISSLADYHPPLPSQIISKDGEILLEAARERRTLVEFEDVPQRIIDAFLAAEDDRFFEHSGIDYQGILRAFIANIRARRVVQGGSTITQQVAKSLLLTSDRSITRKIQDFLLAIRIEKQFSKEEILYLYLNQVYLGSGYYGVVAAFDGYFNKTLEEATIAESALIAGLLVAPGRFSPYRNPRFAKRRQAYVLRRLLETNKISPEEFEQAVNEQIVFQIRRPRAMKGGHFTDWVRQRVIEQLGEEEFLTGGYRIHTTLNWKLQEHAERHMVRGLKNIDQRQGHHGPIKTLELDDGDFWGAEKWLRNQREELLRGFSQHFVFNEKLEREYQYQIDLEWWESQKERQEKWNEVVSDQRFIVGNDSEGDKLLSLLEGGEMYQAMVVHADNQQRLIYVSIGGVMGIIPFNHFRWARERNITSTRENWQWVTRPTEIVSPGDVVWVRLFRRSVSSWAYMHRPYRDQLAQIQDQDKLRKIREARYTLLFLDQHPDVEGALVSIHPQSGEIISLVGGQDFRRSQFSRAVQARRQLGSSFKPLLYAAALEHGYTPSTIVYDTPEALAGVDEDLDWRPRNYDHQFKGPITFRNSLEQSRNVPTIKIAEDLGVRTIHQFVERIGFDATLPPDLTLSLGTFGATLLDLVMTFGIFPNNGRLIEPVSVTKVYDRFGRRVDFNDRIRPRDVQAIVDEIEKKAEQEQREHDLLSDYDILEQEQIEKIEVNPFHKNLTKKQVYDPRLAYVMTNLLRGAIEYGTGQGAKSVSSFIGGKTGTTNNFVDAWFVGFSADVVTGVWTGFDDNQTMGFAETGARAALPIWNEFMSKAIQYYGERDFPTPRGIINVAIDKETGNVTRGARSAFIESFVEGTEPGSTPVNRATTPEQGDFEEVLFEEEGFFR